MKKWLVLAAIVLGTASAFAQAQAQVQPTNAPPTNAQPARASQSLLAQAPGPGALNLPSLELAATKPNEMVVGKLTFSGVAVQAIKAKNPLQLLNPAAPARYGSGQANVVSFPFLGPGPRLKFFSIDF
ncbi:MAG: hypothetical protein ABSH34_25310 [Verrucomicrobiota bacterium]|jgi:hypothetical protein